ncbi:MAG: Rrf2 family transcriptional regulator [Gallionellaceae bacterium]|nr:Rrf2 family transcriptional regulator [Gallionellaceae bacterium]
MKLTKYSDLGLRLLMYLAMRRDEPVTIKEVSERFAISKNHLVKISHRLTLTGLVESSKGRNGGIRLARAPESISVEQALRATEDNFDLVECFAAGQNQCVISGACKLTGVLLSARTAFFDVLAQVTLADLVGNGRVLERALQPMTATGKTAGGRSS